MSGQWLTWFVVSVVMPSWSDHMIARMRALAAWCRGAVAAVQLLPSPVQQQLRASMYALHALAASRLQCDIALTHRA
jgi:hypothetical protein